MTGTSGIYVTYEIPGNTYSVGKTNFWTYAQQLFGMSLAPNTGLAGFGLSGTMTAVDTLNYQHAEGIPITAFPDATPNVENPFQLTLIKAYSPTGTLLASTQSVIPVSHEINCVSSGCHSSELDILEEHEEVQGFNIADKPIFCATCHADNALGMPGQPGIPPFSHVIHEKHGEFIHTGTTADCYKCHPGPDTQCWRDVMHTTTGLITSCQDCHGSVQTVGHSIDEGREPWLEEPSCGAANCHGPQYAEEPGKLFRQSRGHGGLYCSACHSSPHAILPASRAEDNVQNVSLQGFAGTLIKCSVCHGFTPSGNGPHGIPAVKTVQNQSIGNGQSSCYNATQTITVAGNGTSFTIASGGDATFIAGEKIAFLPGTMIQSGGHMWAYITTKGRFCNTPLPPMALQPLPISEKTVERADESDFITVYPNPFTETFTLELDPVLAGDPLHIVIYGTLGNKVLMERRKCSHKTSFSLAPYPSGIYYLKIFAGEHTATLKIIKE